MFQFSRRISINNAFLNQRRNLRGRKSVQLLEKDPEPEELQLAPRQGAPRNSAAISREKVKAKVQPSTTEKQKPKIQEYYEKLSKKLILSKQKYQNKVSAEDVDITNQFAKLADVVTPLHTFSYEKQLEIKYRHNRLVLFRLRDLLHEKGINYRVNVIPVRKSNAVLEYRNRDEFSIWDGVDGDPKTVGHFIGNPQTKMVCVPSTKLNIIKQSHKRVASHFQNYIRQSNYGVCKSFAETDTGIYRNVLARSNEENQVMAVVTIHPKNLTTDELTNEMGRVRYYFTEGPGKECSLHSLYFQASHYAYHTAERAPLYHLHGEEYLKSKLLGMNFQISPDAYFPINHSSAEVLYSTIMELVQPNLKTTLLDLCCGIGGVTTMLAPYVCRSIGCDTSSQAIENAKTNAKLNNLTNVSFLNSSAENMLPNISRMFPTDEVVAVLSAEKSGLRRNLVHAIRECKLIKRVIYITSCSEAPNTMQNLLGFCAKEDRYSKGSPFKIQMGVPIDTLPQTTQSDLVLLLER